MQTHPRGTASTGDMSAAAGPRPSNGRGEDAITVGALDSLVDLDGKAEIIGRDDEFLARVPPHAAFEDAAPRRSRRNWKNSTPSRSRRFIIVGLSTISATMEAILLLRK